MSDDPLLPVSYRLALIPGRYAICRLPAVAELPDWARLAQASPEHLLSLIWRRDETSIVCPERFVPPEIEAERGWRVLEVAGPLEFELVGVLASLLEPLKQAGVSVFVLSTFDTDLILIREALLDQAIRALGKAGHLVE